MKLANALYVPVPGHHKSHMPPGYGKSANSGKPAWSHTTEEDSVVLLDLSFDISDKDEDENIGFIESLRSEETEETEEDKKPVDLDDPTARLTKRLVSATTKNEIMDILSEAYKALGEALKAAGSGDEEVIKVIKRLSKLISRCLRKNRDLDGEAEVVRKEKKAKKDELEQLAKQHEMELKRRIIERKKREKKYLQDPDARDDEEKEKNRISLSNVPKAELEAMLQQMLGVAAMALSPETYSDTAYADSGVSTGSMGAVSGGTVAESSEVSE